MNVEKIIIDRFENMLVVCEKEDKSIIHLERTKFTSDAKEGDCFFLSLSGEILPDKERTNDRVQKIRSLMDRLKET